MSSHLSDVAFLEWVRTRTTKFAPETPMRVEVHLDRCEPCRVKLEQFRALEQGMHAFGAPMATPGALRFGRAILALGVVAALATTAWLISRALTSG